MGDRLFPLVDRRTPLLDRLESGRASSFTDKTAKELVAVRDSDEEDVMEIMDTFSNNFRESLADEMGMKPEDVNPELVEEFMSFVFFEGSFVADEEENGEGDGEDEQNGEEDESNPLEDLSSSDQE